MKIFTLTIAALVCFALNSVLCRLALKSGEADAASFTLVRIVSGAAVLTLIYYFSGRKKTVKKSGNWLSAFFLFAYAICFSFAYVELTTAAGALILFGSVQMTMIAAAFLKGERPRALEWFGLAGAFGGLVYLVFPGIASSPLPLFSSFLMIGAGAAWGFYTLRGKQSSDPISDTFGNFARAAPLAIAAFVPFAGGAQLSAKGAALAILSGAIASGVGYSIWYAALRFHTATRAAILQLSVPAIASVGGVLFLHETLSARLLIASLLILGGIGLAIFGRSKKV